MNEYISKLETKIVRKVQMWTKESHVLYLHSSSRDSLSMQMGLLMLLSLNSWAWTTAVSLGIFSSISVLDVIVNHACRFLVFLVWSFFMCFCYLFRQNFRPSEAVWPGREGLSSRVTTRGWRFHTVTYWQWNVRKPVYDLSLNFLICKMENSNLYLPGSLWG